MSPVAGTGGGEDKTDGNDSSGGSATCDPGAANVPAGSAPPAPSSATSILGGS
jgi:hypothetical protein